MLKITEENDQKLIEALVFSPSGLVLNRIAKGATKTPDFQVTLNGLLVAYCELKSPRDEWLDDMLDALQPGELIGGYREDPTFKKIRNHSNHASKQFEAINPNKAVPNILVFVNHDDSTGFGDLLEVFTGVFHAAGGSQHTTMPELALSLDRAKRNIDLCIWLDGIEKRVDGYLFNFDAHPSHTSQLCVLLGIDASKIRC